MGAREIKYVPSGCIAYLVKSLVIGNRISTVSEVRKYHIHVVQEIKHAGNGSCDLDQHQQPFN